MSRVVLFALAALALAAGPAAAQGGNLVLEHYRAYRAALDQGNLEAAEESAEQALGASEYRDGDGGRTAVLALNLAGVHLMQGEYADALGPARRALALTEARGEVSGVDPILAQIILGRAELGGGDGEAGAVRLLAALPQAESMNHIFGETYPAAFELARWLLAHERYQDARQAWRLSGRFAEGAAIGAEIARARARLGEGVAAFLGGIEDRRRLRRDEASQVSAALLEAMELAAPQLMRESQNSLDVTPAQAVYAEAMAWRAALRVQMGSRGRALQRAENRARAAQAENQDDAGEEAGLEEETELEQEERLADPDNAGSAPVCRFRLRPNPMPTYPSSALSHGNVGAVVVRLQFDDSGEVIDRRVLASVGGVFEAAVISVLPRWSIAFRGPEPPLCRMPRRANVPVAFGLGY